MTLEVNGHCMAGSLPHGSRVRIERQAWYLTGDIVLYGRADNRLVVHRFLGYVPGHRGWRGVTRADNECRADSPVPLERLVGKVKRIDHLDVHCTTSQRLLASGQYLRVLGAMTVRFLKKLAANVGN